MTPGKIILHPKFKFHDGKVRDKILISLGTRDETTILVKTTSRGYRYEQTFGCQCEHRFPHFHLARHCCVLHFPTWVCLDEYYEFDSGVLEIKHAAAEFKLLGDLNGELMGQLARCAIDTDDISSHQEKIVREANRL